MTTVFGCARCSHPTTDPICWACLETLRSMSAWGIEWWAPVRGWEGYEVSNLGRFRSPDQNVRTRDKSGNSAPPFLGQTANTAVISFFIAAPPQLRNHRGSQRRCPPSAEPPGSGTVCRRPLRRR